MNAPASLLQWLQAHGLEALEPVFSAEDVDLSTLLELSMQDLIDLGISLGNRKRLMKAIETHQSQPAPGLNVADEPGPDTPPADNVAACVPDETVVPLKLFLSYGRDQYVAEVRALKVALEARGHQVWFDEEQLAGGRDWEMRIEQGLAWCDRVVLTMTPHSVRRPDGYCLNEIAKALERQKLIIPVLIDDVPDGAPTSICRIQYLDWRDAVPAAEKAERFQARLARLCQAIERDMLDFEGGQQRLISALQPLNYRSNIDRHVARFQGRVALFERIKHWMHDPDGRQVFWLRGGPGLGKSAIAAALAHRWSEVGAVHFCEASHSDKRDASRAVLSIVYQLSTHLDTYRVRLSQLDLKSETFKDARTLFDNLLVEQLARNFPVPSHPWVVVIDALDEATQPDGSNLLADLIAHDWGRLPSWLKLMVSSRPDMEVVSRLQSIEPVNMSGADPEQQADLKDYIQASLHAMGREPEVGSVDRILARSEGVYEYVVRLLEDVKEGRCDPNDPVDLPRGLNGVYLQSFRRRFPVIERYFEQCRPLLELILASPEPVPVQVLANATNQGVLEVRRRLASLGSMLTQQPAQAGWGAQWGTVAPSHASLKSWLVGLDAVTQFQVAGDFGIEADAGLAPLATEVLKAWEEGQSGSAEANPPQRHEYVCRTVWGLLTARGDTAAMDRVALDVSLYWENRALELALAPAEHAAAVSEQLASNPDASVEALERAAGCARHLGDVLGSTGDTGGALAAFKRGGSYCERLAPQDRLNAGWQRDLAVSYNRIGGVLKSQGDLTGALEMFNKVLAIAERLAAQDPRNAGWQSDLAGSYNWIGGVLESQGDLTGALEMFNKDLAITERLAAQDPLNAGWQSDLAGSYNWIGGVLESQGDLTGALEMFNKDLAIAERLAAQDRLNAGWQRDLAVSYNRIGGVLKSQGNLTGALEMFNKVLAITERLAAQDPLNAGWQRNLAGSYNRIGGVLKSQGNLTGALEMFNKDLAIAERLAAQDPRNAGWQSDLAGSYNWIGGVLESQGDLTGALEMFNKDLAITERLAAQDPLNAGWQSDLAVSYNRIGGVLESQGNLTGALEMFNKRLAIVERLAEQDPLNELWQSYLANILYKTGAIHEKLLQFVEAAAVWRRELDVRANMLNQTADFSEGNDDLASCCNQIGGALEANGDFEGARESFRHFLELSEKTHDRDPENPTNKRTVAVARISLARTELALGNLEPARSLLNQAAPAFGALRDSEDPGSQMDWAASLALGAEIAEAEGDSKTLMSMQDELAALDLGAAEPVGRFRKRFMPLIRKHLEAAQARRRGL